MPSGIHVAAPYRRSPLLVAIYVRRIQEQIRVACSLRVAVGTFAFGTRYKAGVDTQISYFITVIMPIDDLCQALADCGKRHDFFRFLGSISQQFPGLDAYNCFASGPLNKSRFAIRPVLQRCSGVLTHFGVSKKSSVKL